MSRAVPKYRKHPNGYAFVEHCSVANRSRRMFLGKYGSPESRQRYQSFLATLDGHSATLIVRPGTWPTIDELVDAYLTHAETFYMRPHGISSEYDGMCHALGVLAPYGELLPTAFGPKLLTVIRARMAQEGYLRSTVNHTLSRVKKFFRWCCEQELAPPELYHKLLCVRGLVAGQDQCAEPEAIEPAAKASIDGVLPFLSPTVAAMVDVQYWCGMRPGETCIMRSEDIDRSADIWLYYPQRHKNKWRGYSQVKAIPEPAQKVLSPYLDKPSYLFEPGRQRKHYVTETYRRALAYGFRKAAKNGVELEPFRPNQLRHAIATHVAQRLGLQAAQVLCGHKDINTTGIYAAKEISELMEVARQVDSRWRTSA